MPVPPSANKTAEDTIERLSREPGFNLSRGLAALRGNQLKYLELLSRFAVTHADDMARLAETLDKGDQAGAQRIAHTIKGTAATLGADHLSEMSKLLEEKLRKQYVSPLRSDDFRADMDKISHAFMALMSALPQKPDIVDAASSARVNPEIVKKILHELDTLLAQSDTSAIALLEKNAALLRSALGSLFEKLANQINGFDFDKARETLKILL